jgi:tripartite-type tricarboxylate transporter receptor subunit TctC
MSADLGQAIVIDNQPGASGIVGMRTGARAAPDGYTILGVNDSIMAMLPKMKDDVGYDPVADFAPITQMVTINFGLVANPSLGASTLKEFIDMALQKPGAIDYGSGGPGSPQHVAMEMLMRATGMRLNHVPYRGVTPAFNDVVGGHIPVMIVGLPLPNEFVAAGKLKMLATTSIHRSKVFPDIPTIAEAGVPGFDFTTWGALVAPAHTPPAIVARLNASAVKAMRDPAVAKQLDNLGFNVIANTPDEFAASLKEGLTRYGDLSRAANIHID